MGKVGNGINGFKAFLGEVKLELTKCNWPTKKELVQSTWVVILSCILLSAFVGISDYLLSLVVKMLVS